MSFADLIHEVDTVSAQLIDPNGGGTTTIDPVTYEPVYTPADPITVTGVLTQLSSSELVARQQLQDNSTYKLIVDDTTRNRTIDHTYSATIGADNYKITGEPKKPVLNGCWITIYLSKS